MTAIIVLLSLQLVVTLACFGRLGDLLVALKELERWR